MDLRAGRAIGVVVGADAGAGPGLDQHFVAVLDQLFADRPGVRPTRYSWFLISLGQPMRMESFLSDRAVTSETGYAQRRPNFRVTQATRRRKVSPPENGGFPPVRGPAG